ncbi:hypothetical protein BGZ96_003523, partial [Linnemannia gamsii]
MPDQGHFPPETLCLIFSYLPRQDLARCLYVSRLWHAEAKPQLYKIILLVPGMKLNRQLAAVKDRKALVRRVEWRPCQYGSLVPPADLLDFFLDYRPASKHSENNSNNNKRAQPQNCPVAYPIPLESSRLTLKQFSFTGGQQSWNLFDSILYSLKSLVSLDLQFVKGNGTGKAYVVDLDRILTGFPRLKHLGLSGLMLGYAPPRTAGHEEDRYGNDDEETRTEHGLESFAFTPLLMWRKGPDAFTFLERLRHLRKIVVRSQWNYLNCAERAQPWAFGRALQQCCPKLESIDAFGAVILWLFDLPIIPSDKIPHLTSLVIEPPPSINGSDMLSVSMAQKMLKALKEDENILKQRLQEQELGELLEGRSAKPFFPQLRTLILGPDHSLSAQDLISLGVQARNLTHVKITHEMYNYAGVWNMYDTDAAATAAAATAPSDAATHHSTSSSAVTNKLIEDRRLWKRRCIGNQDVTLFLQLCSSLQHFSITGRTIPFFDLAVGDITTPGGPGTTFSTPGKVETLAIHPWACEENLQTLKFGLSLHEKRPKEQHAMVWKHFGRFQKLRSLTLPVSSLVPSPAYGVEGLLTGGGRLSETLTEIRSLPSWWVVEDRREMVLWFARSFPNLLVLGLMRYREKVEGGKAEDYTDFLEDEDVKRCSIHRIFIEDRPFE